MKGLINFRAEVRAYEASYNKQDGYSIDESKPILIEGEYTIDRIGSFYTVLSRRNTFVAVFTSSLPEKYTKGVGV